MTEISSLTTHEFKALSSTTRTAILKMLGERNYTLSELSAKTGMAAPTVKQHASILMDSGLIELLDEGRKWKYYSLTKKGKQILDSRQKQTSFMLILSSGIIIAMVGFLAFANIGTDSMLAQKTFSGAGTENTSIIPLIQGENMTQTAGKDALGISMPGCRTADENSGEQEACANSPTQE
ncbi:MAG: winged helix-turn-helix domain-containing protein, partial [archaeon]|nr:winged helix-turn-helix domain-containing protein [archaeon]